MIGTKGTVVAVNGNMVSVRFDGIVSMNEVGYVKVADSKLKSEVIRIRGNISQLQVFEITKGITVGDEVEFTGDMLSVEVGPGLLGQVYDGLQNPLPQLAKAAGYFLERGVYIDPLPGDISWQFTPKAKQGDKVERADTLGTSRKARLSTASWFPSIFTAHIPFYGLSPKALIKSTIP